MSISTNEEKSQSEYKVALIHDFLTQYGGAERVLETLSEMFSEAPIYTLLYDEEKMKKSPLLFFLKRGRIRTSFLQKFPKFLRQRKRWLVPFMPTAPETFDLRDFDLVISSSGAWSKGIVTRLNTVHIAYIHSPMRFVWDYNEKYLKSIGQRAGILKRMCLSYLRLWDYEAVQRPDYLIANSKYTQERIKKYYRRESEIIYPPCVFPLNPSPKNKGKNLPVNCQPQADNYFLIISRLSPYKKVDLAVETFNKLGLPLVVIGEGEQAQYLKKIARKNIKILGWQDDAIAQKYYAGARAFIFPAVDDFGMTMVEAMSYGTPVIAIRKGGAKEIVQEGINGEFFDAQTPEVMADGVRRFMENENKYDKEKIKKTAEKFSKEKFKEDMYKIVNNALSKN